MNRQKQKDIDKQTDGREWKDCYENQVLNVNNNYLNFIQEKSSARADADGDDEDDTKAEEDRELLEALVENKEQNNGN